MSATIKDVARMAGVSIYSVSKFINGGQLKPNNHEAVRKAVEALGYKPNAIAQSLRTSCSMTVGIVLPNISERFNARLAQSMEKALSQYGYSTILCTCDNDAAMQAEKFSLCRRKNCDAIITVPMGSDPEHIIGAMEAEVPVVCVANRCEGVECDFVAGDDRSVMKDAVKYLISLGHSDIAFVAGDIGLFSTQQRKAGYMDAMAANGLLISASFLKENAVSMADGYSSMMELWMEQKRPTAVIFGTYETTLGAAYAISKRRIFVPDEVSVIGFDNRGLGAFTNPVYNCIEQDIDKMGELAATLALKRIGKEMDDFPRVVTVQDSLDAGESVGRCIVNWKTTTRFRMVGQ